MNLLVGIYKEKKNEDFRMVILPSGKNKIGLGKYKDYGIISYLNKKNAKKIGELIFWALSESDNEKIEDEVNVQWCKQYFNCSSNLKVVNEYNNIGFKFFENKYKIYLKMKDGRGYSPFKDENGNMVEYTFPEKPTALELGTKVMEMFEYKERYDGLIE
ncbi:osmolarity sensor protein EnvZ [Fusobacterium sp. 1001295B_180824_G3]|uniref:osmolarity sensor protein EnvZ n=1 Tax=Fusobacterium sp. 1001295B_180824_G3 TaxID=2787123 RepID=UPI00189AB7F1|nr:osmolarity sensor protein EnvZ [Fusobacterium sp. 1001295B_180824_G3]